MKPEAIPRRLAWVIWRKKLHVDQVELFAMMVHKLHELVPPDAEETAWRARNQSPSGMDVDIGINLSSDRRQTPSRHIFSTYIRFSNVWTDKSEVSAVSIVVISS